MAANNSEKTTIDYLKAYAFPGVLSVLTMIVYNDIQEVKSDVKALLSQASSDRVKIEYLEREVELLRKKNLAFYSGPVKRKDAPKPQPLFQSYAILPGKDDYIEQRNIYYSSL
jgi:hypothetical protein